jgi:hypothetical protein
MNNTKEEGASASAEQALIIFDGGTGRIARLPHIIWF